MEQKEKEIQQIGISELLKLHIEKSASKIVLLF